MNYPGIAAAVFACGLILSCSKDEKASAERDKEVQRVLQEGAQREQKMYEGMQKGVEKLDKAPEDQKAK